MDKKLKLLAGVIIIILSLWMSVGAIEDFLNPIKFVSEVTARPEQHLNRGVQIAGHIVQGSMQMAAPGYYKFRLTDYNATINVEYSGVPLPELKTGVGITVVGVLTSPDTIKSSKVLIKCPSKYEQSLQERKAKT